MTKSHIGFNARDEITEACRNIVNPHSYSKAQVIMENAEFPRRYIGFQRTPYDPTVPVVASTIGYQSERRDHVGRVVPYSEGLWEQVMKERENPPKEPKTQSKR